MAIPPLDLKSEHAPIRDALMAALGGVMDSCAFCLGPAVETFEQAMADHCGTKHAIGVSSGTDALLVALMAKCIGPGDQVICPAFTFFATAGSIWRTGARPVFVDIEPDTYNIDPQKIEAAITEQTRAIMPVHLFGQCADMNAITDIARRHNLAIIEDAAQATGAKDHERPAGAIGDLGCLSFYPTKNLGGLGEGGMILTNDDDLARTCRYLRNHGQVDTYRHTMIGGNFRLHGFQGAVLNVKLQHADEYIASRRRLAARYIEKLGDLPITLPATAEGQFHTYNQFTLRIGDGRRDALSEHLKAKSIGNRIYYPLPLHLQPCFESLGYTEGDLPESERASKQVLSISIFPQMTDAQQDEVVAAVREFFG